VELGWVGEEGVRVEEGGREGLASQTPCRAERGEKWIPYQEIH